MQTFNSTAKRLLTSSPTLPKATLGYESFRVVATLSGCETNNSSNCLTASRLFLPINFTQHNVQRSNNRHHIRHQVSDAKSLQRLQVHKARRAHAHTPGLLRSIG